MENKMMITGFMEEEMAEELRKLQEKQAIERHRANSNMTEAFNNAGVTVLDADAFLIAAAMAKGWAGSNPDMTASRKIFFKLKKMLKAPFTCTIVQNPGSEDKTFEYQVVNKVFQKSLEGMSYDMNGEWSKKGVEIIYWWVKRATTTELADMLRKHYQQFASKIE